MKKCRVGKNNPNWKGGKPKCIDCKKQISYGHKRCKSCARKGQLNPIYNGNSIRYCLDCNKKISKKARRCQSCAKLGERNGAFKNWATKLETYCVDCGKKLGRLAHYGGHVRCSRCCRSGKLSPTYLHGRTKLVEMIRKSVDYDNWRTSVFIRDNYTCQECGKRGGDLEVDHIEPFYVIFQDFLDIYGFLNPIKDKETLFYLSRHFLSFWQISNGRVLCLKCHKKKTSRDRKELFELRKRVRYEKKEICIKK